MWAKVVGDNLEVDFTIMQSEKTERVRRTYPKEKLLGILVQAETNGKKPLLPPEQFQDKQLDEVIAGYLAHLEGSDKSQSSIERARVVLGTFVQFMKDNKCERLWQCTPDLAHRFVDQWRQRPDRGKGRKKRRVSDSTVRRDLVPLFAAVRWAIDLRYLPESMNPLPSFRKLGLPVRNGTRAAVTMEQAEKLLNAAEADPLMYSAIAVMLTLGLRRSCLLSLRKNNLDFTSRTIRIYSPKTKKTRTLPMRGLLEPVLLGRCLADSHELLFASKVGTQLDPDNFKRRFRAIAKQAGEKATAHQLRHFAGTFLLAQGIDPATVADILGCSVRTLLDYYGSHASLERNREALERWTAKLSGLVRSKGVVA